MRGSNEKRAIKERPRKDNTPEEKATPTKPDRTALIIALVAAIPPLILAVVEFIKTGHTLGWW